MGIFHFHKWIYGGNRRMCETCGKKQEHWTGYDGGGWTDISPICPECKGVSKIIDKDFNIIPCPKCNPNHDIPSGA